MLKSKIHRKTAQAKAKTKSKTTNFKTSKEGQTDTKMQLSYKKQPKFKQSTKKS